MKLLLFSFILFLSTFILPQEHYYYEGRRIDLISRPDKVGIVLNHVPHTKVYLQNLLESFLRGNHKLIESDDFIYSIDMPGNKDMMEVELYINTLSNSSELDGILKFVTKIYYGESKSVSQIPADEIIVRLNSLIDLNRLHILNTQYDLQILRNIGDERGFLLKSGNDVGMNALELSDIYYSSGIFEYTEPNFFYPDNGMLHYEPNDPLFNQQWALKNTGQSVPTGGVTSAGDLANAMGIPGADMDVYRAWDFVKGNNQVKIVVYDTGVDASHPDLSANLVTGYNAATNVSSVTSDSEGHGTCCAGIVGARSNNGIGVAGIAGGDNTPGSNCQIMSFRITNNMGGFTTDVNIARGFDTARVRNVHVISNSWGGGTPSATLTNAINNCAYNSRDGKGTVILFSSGNDGYNPPAYPSYLSSVVCVGASTTHDQKKAAGTGNQWWWGGNYGENMNGDLDIVAPTIVWTTDIQGTGGYNTSPGTAGDYISTFNGTSAACPNVAGVAGLIFSVNPDFTAAQVKEFLYRGADKIDNVAYSAYKTYGKWNDYYGYGRVNAYNSVRLAAGVDVTPPTIVHENIPSRSSTYPTFITADIIDQDGSLVRSGGSEAPKIFYMFNKNGAGWPAGFDSAFAVSNSGSTFTFKIPGVGWGTEVKYFIKASDMAGNTTTFPKHASINYPYTLCYYATGNIVEESQKLSNWSFDSGAFLSPAVNFPNAFNILEARIRIYLRHTWMNDLGLLMLWSPDSDANNNRKCLYERNYLVNSATPSGGINGATVSDDATMFWQQGTMPWTNGNFKPEYILKGLNGTNAQGNWWFIGVDHFSGDPADFDSIRINLKKLDGTISPAARLDSPEDSIINFGTISFPSQVDKDFYLKNVGNANLIVGEIFFTGEFADYFSIISSSLSVIAPNDSGLITIRLNTETRALIKTKSYNTITDYENALMEIETNDPSKPLFKISLQTVNPLPVELASFTSLVEGRDIHLFWKTETEVNSFKFEIERTQEVSEEQYSLWIKAGEIPGSGNSNSPKEYHFVDSKLNSGNYIYRLKIIDGDGSYEYSNSIEAEINIPIHFALSNNYPNPFNPVTKFDYQLPSLSDIKLELYSITGEKILEINEDEKAAGYYTLTVDISIAGENISSGIYLCRFIILEKESGKENLNNRKIVYLK
jgi:subtilisin family serine protease